MILDPSDFLKMALIVIVVAVLIVIVLPYLSGRGRR
jgi:competence protein ComGC